MSLARQRLDHGYAFVGLTDAWAMSVCLFVTVFNLPCRKELFRNTRPGSTFTATRSVLTSRDFNRTPKGKPLLPLAFASAFANPSEEQFYVWAQQRFAHDLERNNLTASVCAMHVCPDSSTWFGQLAL
jgi:hypothetical protein